MAEPILAAKDTWFSQGGTSVKRASITQIDIVDGPYTPSGTVTSSWDASAAKDGSVMAYVEGTKLTISGNGYGRVYANPNSSYAFSSSGSDRFSSLTAVNGANLLDTSKATTMNSMFRFAVKLNSIDVSNWDTSNVTDMFCMFATKSGTEMALETLDVSNWDTSKVTTIAGIFQWCSNLTSIDVSNWDTSSVTNMQNVFSHCEKLSCIDVKNWNTSKVTNMVSMFNECYALSELDVAPKTVNPGTTNEYIAWDTSSVTTMNAMFQLCSSLKTLDVSDWNTSSVKDLDHMFYGCSQLTEMDLSKWNVSKVTTMSHMFADCFKMENYNFSGWNTASLTTMDAMFNDNRALTSIDVSDFDTGKVTEFSQVFESCSNLSNIIGLDKWDVSKNTRFHESFLGCSSLTELDLSTWDTSSVTVIGKMFSGCSNLETIYVSEKWDMDGVDPNAAFSDGDLANRNVFNGCTKLVGGADTAWADNHIDYSASADDTAYAHIDGGAENPGYLTNIDDPTPLLIQTGTMHKLGLSVRGITGNIAKCSPSGMINALKDTCVDINEQSNIIAQISSALEGKAGGGSASYDTCAVTIENATKLASLDYISTRDEIILPIHYSSSFPSSCEVVKNTIMIVEPSTSYRISGISGQIENVDNHNRILKVTGDATISLGLLCYIKNTEITLADGNRKKVQDITYNDQLLVWDFDNGCYASSYPLWIKEEEIALSYYHCIFENGTTLGLVGSNGNCHAVFCLDDNRFEYANNCVGKMIMTENGATKLLSCEQKHEAVKFYNIITNHHINCYANGVLTSSKLNNIYPIEKMKFVMEDRPIIPIEKFGDIQEEFYHGLRLGENKIEDLEYIQIKLSKMLTKGGN